MIPCNDPAGLSRRQSTLAAARTWLPLALLVITCACAPSGAPSIPAEANRAVSPAARADEPGRPVARTPHDIRRATMIEEQFRARDIDDPRVLEAMSHVPRHEFVAPAQQPMAYDDRPLPIPEGQTISQPYIVALMTQLVRPQPDDRALDVGTGSGYQAAVLAELVDRVHGIEIHEALAESARERLQRLGYQNVEVRAGDGFQGWLEHAPFDVIILAAAPSEVPPALVEQLAPGGRLVLPVGSLGLQDLILIEKQPDGTTTRRNIAPVAFVPMTGEAERRRQEGPN